MSRLIKCSLIYVSIVFGAGFVLGVVRIMMHESRLGARMAELSEMPIMFVVMVGAAVFLFRRKQHELSSVRLLGVGFVALGLMLFLESASVLTLREMSMAENVASRDPVSGSVYLIMLGLFALMPFLVTRGHVGSGQENHGNLSNPLQPNCRRKTGFLGKPPSIR